MKELRLAVIGCGKAKSEQGATGFGMSHRHMLGYQRCDAVRLAAVADISRENAEAFVNQYGGGKVYLDYRQMLQEERPDVVSVGTWPKLHAEMVIAAAEAGAKAVHCEKPMALTFGESKSMVETCERTGTQLSFNHQRRFNPPFVKVREMLRTGAIGELKRMEFFTGNMYDWGTHWFDMMFYYNQETPANWVIGQIDTRNTRDIFGAPCEGQGISHIKFENNVRATMITGHETDTSVQQRLVGTTGTIEVDKADGKDFRIWTKGQSDWQTIETAPSDGTEMTALGVIDLIDALRTKREPELSGRRALRATELIFATYESSRKRGRVDLPLTIEDSPLMEMCGRKA